MTVFKSLVLFALAEIGGAWLVWQGVREHKGILWIAAGIMALGAYGFVATFQPDANFGRVLAAYGGVFVAGSLAWGMAVDGFRPDRWDVIGAAICLTGVAVIMYAPADSRTRQTSAGSRDLAARRAVHARGEVQQASRCSRGWVSGMRMATVTPEARERITAAQTAARRSHRSATTPPRTAPAA